MPDMSGLKLLVAEDQTLVRQGLVALLSDAVGEIVEVDNGADALNQLKTGQFDLALIDIGLPALTGMDVLAQARVRGLATKIIILTGDTASHSPKQVHAAGADGFVYKTADVDKFLSIFETAIAGTAPPPVHDADGENAAEVAELRDRLTPRELQIVKLVVEGGSNKTVAEALSISDHTVRKHREHINRKLNIHSPAALASFAIKAGLV